MERFIGVTFLWLAIIVMFVAGILLVAGGLPPQIIFYFFVAAVLVSVWSGLGLMLQGVFMLATLCLFNIFGIFIGGVFLLFSTFYTIGHYLEENNPPWKKAASSKEDSFIFVKILRGIVSLVLFLFIKPIGFLLNPIPAENDKKDPTLKDVCAANPAINIYPQLLGTMPTTPAFAATYALFLYLTFNKQNPLPSLGLLVAAAAFYFVKPTALRIVAAVALHAYTLYWFDWADEVLVLFLLAAFKFIIDPLYCFAKKMQAEDAGKIEKAVSS